MSARDELERLYGNKGEKKPGKGIASAVAGVASRAVSTAENMVARTTGNSSRKTARQTLREQYGSSDAPGAVRARSAREGREKFNRENDPRRNIARRVVGAPEQAPNDQWQEDWLEEFYVRYNTDQDSAYSYAKEVNDHLASQRLAADRERIKKTAARNPVASMIAGVVASPFGLVDAADKGLTYLATGELPQRDKVTLGDVSRVMTSGAAEGLNERYGTLDEDIPVIGGRGWGDAYSLGNSALQSLVLGNTIGSAATLATFFGQGASSGMEEIKARGGSDGQAILYGLISGGAEVLTEKLPLDNLLKGGDAVRFTLKGWLGNAAKQGLLEGGEELASSIANEMADRWIMGDKSNFAVRVQEYMTQGMDEEEAKKKAWLDYANDAAFDFIGGAASGAGSMTVQTALPTALANYQTGRTSTPESNAALIERALAADEGTKPHKLAQKYQGAEKLTGGQINDLAAAYQEYEAQMRYTLATEKAGEKLEELDAEDSTVATAIAKTLTGKDLNRRERRALERSAEGKRVLQQMQSDRSWQQEETGAENATVEPSGISGQLNEEESASYRQVTGKLAAEAPEAAQAVDMAVEDVDDGDFAASESGKAVFDGKPVDIKGIADTKGDMTLELADGRTVKASEVLYASEGEALVYEAVASLGAPAEIGNILVKNYRDGAEDVEAEDYAAGMALAFNHGRYNLPQQQMTDNPYIAKLTEVQRNSAYVLGQRFGGKQVASQQAIARRARFGQRFKQMGQPFTGRVHYDGDVRTLNARQRASVAALEKVADALGVQIHLFESQVDENGIRQGENGWYNTTTGDIGIDIHAGISGEGTMLFTAAHELTHFIKQWSPAKFKVLANFLMEQYGEKGISVEELVEQQQAKAMRAGRELSFDEAFEELVADSMETMLADGNVLEKLTKLGEQDRNLLEKMRDGILELVQKIREVYKGLKPDSREGRYVAEMKDSLERLQELFTEALEEAGRNFQAAKQTEAAASSQQNAEGAAQVQRGSENVHSEATKANETEQEDFDWEEIDANLEFSRRDYARQVDDVKNNTHDRNNHVYMGTTPTGIVNIIGLPKLPMLVTANHVYSMAVSAQQAKAEKRYNSKVHYHDLGWDTVKALPDYINKPVLIIKSNTDPNDARFVVITSQTDSAGRPIMAAIKPNGAGNYFNIEFPTNAMLSSYGRTGIQGYVARAKTENRILYANKNSQKQKNTKGVQFSNNILASDYSTNLAQFKRIVKSQFKGTVFENGGLPKFSLRQPVEETKTLIAMHNLTEEKLEKAIDLGGFPMPSIAVTRSDIPHTNFGEITLVMDKDTVDPKADRRNDVFSADAWTPTFPRTEYEVNSEVEDRVRRTLKELERKIAPQFQGNLRRVIYGLEDLLNSYDGEENLIGHVLDNDGMKAVYLESQGKHIDEVQVEQEVPKRFNQAAKDKYEAIIAALGTRDPAEIRTMPLKDIRDNYGTELEKIVPGISKTALRLSRFMQQTIDYLMDDGSGPATEMVVDQNATRRAMEDALDREGYEAWVRELFSGIEGNKGIYNGKERFTPSGRSRSFQQTHLPVTLDNIVKAMAAQNGGNTKNVSGFNGVKTLRAGTAKRFKSVQGMHDLEGRLQNLTEEDQTALTDGLQSRLYDLIDEIDREAGRKGTDNNLIRFDQIGQIITEASETGRYNVADIQKVFQENHRTISDEVALKVKELLFDVSQMPVNLFEAKPRRAVRFDEVRAAVVPADTSEDLKRKLAEQGVPVIEYERDNTDDRLQKVNSVEGVKFSDRDPAAQKLNRALEKENAAQAQEIQYLRELVKLQGQVTNGTKFTRSSVRSLAQQLMKDAGAKGNYLELSEKLNGIYESIATQDDPLGMSWSEVEGRIDEAARWLVEHIEVKPDRGEYANDILRDLRGRKISLNDGQRAEVEGRYGSYDTFRKSMFGSVTISKDGTPLDMVWQELAGQHPGTFDADIGDADMALELADVVARLRETDVAAMEFEMQRDGLLEDLRQKVYDGYWKVSTLHTVADKWQKKVDALKQQHQDTMKKLDKARQERDAANADRIDSVKKVREQKNEAVKKVRQQYQESKKKSVEGRKKTEMRHKIQRVVKELNDLLLKPDKKRHVPEGLRKVVAEALDMVNMDYLDAAGKIEAINDELAQLHTKRVIARKAGDTKEAAELLGKIRQLEQRKARLEDQGGRMDEKLEALHTAYEKIKESADPEIANAYDEGLSSYILMKAAMVGDTPLKNMNIEQLGHVYDLYQMVLTTIRDSNKQLTDALNAGHRESAEAAEREITSNGKRNRLGIKMVEQLRKFGINNLKPTYFFHYLNAQTFRQLYQGLLDGQGQFGRNMDEARSFRQEQAKKYGAKNWDREKTWKFKAASGERFSLNLEQIMSLYAYSKRDQSREHIRRGGIVIDAETEIQEVVEVAGGFKVKLKGKSQDATAYNIDDVTLDEIIGKLTVKQRAYVDAMQDYLSDTMGAKGNEISLKLYGIKLFKEKHYFPLKSAKEYSARAKEQAEQTARLKNAGFTKATKPHASNPIMLTGFSDVWADHVQDMSSYHAMTLPLEDLYRVYNYSRNGDGVKGARSVVAAIENAFGKQATGYMDQLLKDLNGGQIMDSAGELLEQMTSRFKKGAVFMSASVMIQQSSSVARALAEIDAKYLSPLSYVESLTVIPRQLLGKVNKNASRSHDALWAELKRYAPVAIIKEMGSFDMNMGKSGRDYLNGEEYSGLQEKWQAFWKDGNFRDELLSRGPALADELAWCDIWRAVKREVHDKHPKLKIGSEEFLKLCGARFTEIIDKTQVYDSVLSRSANMRSKNGAMKMATNFMAEPTVNSNMMAAAILEGKRGNAKKARRMAGAVMAGNIINAALAAIVYAARDDDEDEEYWEKYLGHLAGEVADSMNPLTYIPVAQDIVSVFQGWDVERADMAIVSDLYNAWNKLFSDKATTWEKARDMIGATTQIFGLPLKNALKDAEALWRVVSDAFDGQESTATGIGYAILAELPEWIPGGGVRSNGDQLYESILKGDKAHEERVRARFKDKDGNIDEGKARSALRKAIRENDSRIREAAVYLNEGQLLEYYNIVEEITGEGFFHKDDVVSAIGSEASSLQEDGGDKETATHHKSAFKAEHFAIAAADGDSQMMNIIKADLVLTAQANGKTEAEAEKAAVSSIRGAVKEAFVDGDTLSEAQVQKALTGWCDATKEEAEGIVEEWNFEKRNGYALSELKDALAGGEVTADEAEDILVSYGGKTREEAELTIQAYRWRSEHPEYEDLSDDKIDRYIRFCKGAGISVQDFYEANEQVSEIKEAGGAQKENVVRYIRSLPLSKQQKWALWYAVKTKNWKDNVSF